MDMPPAEVDIDARLIELLVDVQFPELAAPVEIVAHGWDNVVARLGEKWTVRMPRRAAAVPLVLREARWLPELAGMLPVAVPTPTHVGRPGPGYAWPWLISPWLGGRPANEVDVEQRRAMATDLAAVHRALHQAAPPDAPPNPVRGGPLASRADAVAERLASGAVPHARRLRTLFDRALAAPRYAGPPVWIHGDPHPGNLLLTPISADFRLAAMIDFGDLGAGDPATDLAVAWLGFDQQGRDAYRAALGDQADDDTWARAHGWAVVLTTALAVASDDNRAMAEIAAHALEQVMADAPMPALAQEPEPASTES